MNRREFELIRDFRAEQLAQHRQRRAAWCFVVAAAVSLLAALFTAFHIWG